MSDDNNRKLNAENLEMSKIIGRLRVIEMKEKYPAAKAVYREQIEALKHKQQENLKRMNRYESP